MLWTLVVMLSAPGWADDPLNVGVLHEEPHSALMLHAAVVAALQQEPGPHELWPRPVHSEPGEPLGLLHDLCHLSATTVGAVCGGTSVPQLTSGAARAGLALLAVEGESAAGPGAPVLWLEAGARATAAAGRALLEDKGWERAVLLYAPGARTSLRPLLAAPMHVSARRLPPEHDAALLRDLFLVLKKAGETNFIVWCSRPCLQRVLKAAQGAGVLSERHSYLLLDGELRADELEDYSYGGANITGLRLFDPEAEHIQYLGDVWYNEYMRLVPEPSLEVQELALRQKAAPSAALVLAYDAAVLLSRALSHLSPPPAALLSCSTPCLRPCSLLAETLLNQLRATELMDAASGPLRFHEDGTRREPRLEVVELVRGGILQRVAWWQTELSWERMDVVTPTAYTDSMTNRTFNVLIAINEPYVMEKKSIEKLTGNSRYEGFCIELIERLAQQLHFNFTFVLQKDGKYGSLIDNQTNRWNGMMQRLIQDQDIHFAITDLTITAEREKAVDFTTPFMNLGISILFKRPEHPEPELFAFLLPFSNGVWLSLGFAYLGSSLILYVVGRVCPEEWQNPYPCVDEPAALENQFTLANALWFNLGAVLLQGSEIAPVAYGSRAVASIWWLFALVITSSYTANLATLLAKKTNTELIHNVQELATNPYGITYGAKAGGSTYTFFEHSQNKLFTEMYKHMQQHEMPRTNDEGANKVMKGKYAFLMESTTIEHLTQRNCEVKQVGAILDNKGYGIAMKKNSTYRQSMNLALLNLQERGILREMKHQWWNEKNGGGSCDSGGSENESEELSMKNFLGLFLVLVVGSVLGVVVSAVDLVLHSWQRARRKQVPWSTQLRAELRFVFRFSRSEKPLELSLTPTPESSARTGSGSRDAEGSGSRGVRGSGSGGAEDSGSAGRSPERRTSARRRSTQHTIHSASVRLARHGRRRS